MDVRESKFYYAGHDMNFAVFSDYPVRRDSSRALPCRSAIRR